MKDTKIAAIRLGSHEIELDVFGKTGAIHNVTVSRRHSRNFNYLENFGRLLDMVEDEAGEPLSEADKTHIVRCCRETLMEWSK